MTRRARDKGRCSVDGCTRPAWATGLCTTHYHRLRKHGDVRAHSPVGRYSRSSEPRLPLEPLYRYAGRLLDRPLHTAGTRGRCENCPECVTNGRVAALVGVSVDAILKHRRRGVTAEVGDRFAVALGTHPLMVWGDAWLDLGAAVA